jgi:hypothetical protein
MKRLQKIIHVSLVWTSVCLMSADPASACRLLANRRCCCCCCCPAVAECNEKSPPPAAEPSPSDLPRPTASHGDLPPALSNNAPPVLPSVDVTPPATNAGEPSRTPAAGISSIPNNSPDSFGASPTVDSDVQRRPAATADSPVAVDPPAPADRATTREPSDVGTPATASVAAPQIESNQTKPNLSTEIAAPQPQNTPLTPRQTFGATRGTVPSAPSPERASNLAQDEATGQPTRKTNDSPAHASVEPTRENTEKPLAGPTVSVPASPVATPDFPTVSDDPFAPIVAPSPVPMNTDNHADDPFAPLPTSPAANEKPAAPLVLEPTLKKLDMLTPGADGRLPLRQWTDDSGKFNVEAKLVLILDGKVRLLKETGRTTTVAIERLSKADRAYVAEAIERYGEDLAKLHQLASR